MRKTLLAGLSLFILNTTTGCTVYKSSDRDDFNSNGKTRAATTATKPVQTALSYEDQSLLENPCSALDGVDQLEIESLFGAPARVSMTRQVSRKTSTCLITNGAASRDLANVSVLACSWKPVDGEPIPANDLNVQTTEDDLREQGFSVVTTAVASGDRLRMNCEAYVPTDSLVDDRERGEPATLELAKTFSKFALELKVSTLSNDGAR